MANLLAAVRFASVYRISQSVAVLCPNTLFFDPKIDVPKNYTAGLLAQSMFLIVFLSLTDIATLVGVLRIGSGRHGQVES